MLKITSAVLALALAGCATINPTKTISLIGIEVCDQWMGAVVVTQDGNVHPSTEITIAAARAIASALPKTNIIVSQGPCMLAEPDPSARAT
jgi:hypothetical protein